MNLSRQMNKKQDILIETEQASVMKDNYPKAQYHFLIVAKAEIPKVTKLTREHLPLLDHMMELANQIIEQQQHLPSSCFLVGFKIDAFMDSLTMHVISNDFYSVSMRKLKHWNGFNTDLFLSYQAVYALLQIQGSVESMPEEQALKLRESKPLRCNHCDFECDSLVALKFHLYEHWKKREAKFELKKQVNKITDMLEVAKVEEPQKVEQPESKPKFVPTNWRRNADSPLNQPQEPPANWRQKGKQTENAEQTNLVPYQNPFAKHFQKQQQPQSIGNPRNQVPYAQQGYNPLVPPPSVANGAAYSQQFVPQATGPVPHFNPFRQPPNMAQFPPPNGAMPQRPNWQPRPTYNQGQNHSNLNPNHFNPKATEVMENKANWTPRHPQNQLQNNSNMGQNNYNPIKNQANATLENKSNWKPRNQNNNMAQNNFNSVKTQSRNPNNPCQNNSNPGPLQNSPNKSMENKPNNQKNPCQNNSNLGQVNAAAIETQSNLELQTKPKWKPKNQQNKNPNNLTAKKPNWKPKANQQQSQNHNIPKQVQTPQNQNTQNSKTN